MARPANQDLQEAVSLAHELADAARRIALEHFRTPLAVNRKADGSPVTAADLAIEEELRRRIAQRFPDHGVIGEETGAIRGEHYTWIVDPIDGTKSFVTGSPLFGTLIGLLHHDEAVLGMIEAPAMAERWVGDGKEARLNGQIVRVSDCKSLARARLYATSIDDSAPMERRCFERLVGKVALRRSNADCYAYGLLASGHCDLVVEAGLDPYDYLPLVGVVTGAGGSITDWDGRPLGLDSDGRVIAASTKELLGEAINLLG